MVLTGVQYFLLYYLLIRNDNKNGRKKTQKDLNEITG